MKTALMVLGVGLGGYLLYRWMQSQAVAANPVFSPTAALTGMTSTLSGDAQALLAQGWTRLPDGSMLPPSGALGSFLS